MKKSLPLQRLSLLAVTLLCVFTVAQAQDFWYKGRGHICETLYVPDDPYAIDGKIPYIVGDIVISGTTLFKLSNGSLKIYDLKTGSAPDYNIPSLTKVNSMEIINEKIVIEGVTNTGTIMKGSLDLNSGQFDTNYSNVLTEVRLTALN